MRGLPHSHDHKLHGQASMYAYGNVYIAFIISLVHEIYWSLVRTRVYHVYLYVTKPAALNMYSHRG